jgi:hypothetical protein
MRGKEISFRADTSRIAFLNILYFLSNFNEFIQLFD